MSNSKSKRLEERVNSLSFHPIKRVFYKEVKMKKLLIVGFVFVLLTACSTSSVVEIDDAPESSFITISHEVHSGYYLDIIQDKETGCQFYKQRSFMLPRTDKNGTHICK